MDDITDRPPATRAFLERRRTSPDFGEGDITTTSSLNSKTMQKLVANALDDASKVLQEHHQHILDIVESHFRSSRLKRGGSLQLPSACHTKEFESKVPPALSISANPSLVLPGSVCDETSRVPLVGELVRPVPQAPPPPDTTLGTPDGSPNRLSDLDRNHDKSPKCNLRQSANYDTRASKCEKCGNVFTADAVFCRICGQSRDTATDDGEDSNDGKSQIQFKVLPAWAHRHHHNSRQHLFNGLDMAGLQDKRRSKNQSGLSSLDISDLRSSAITSVTMTSDGTTSIAKDDPEVVMWYLLFPYSTKRGIWDVCSLCLVMYDMVVLPLELFDLPDTTPKTFFEWVTRIFWTLDMGASIITGYVTEDGSIEMAQEKITRRYLRSWFTLDLLVVGIDWIEVFIRSAVGVSYARLSKVTRIFRVVRMVRLLRLARMKDTLDLITERFGSQRILVFVDMGKLLFFILGLGHLIACVWWGIGNFGDGTNTWVVNYKFNTRPIGDQYVMSLNWALSQFVGGMDEITPENVGERVYALICLVFAFVIAALFISSITSSMTELQILGSSEAKKVSMLRIFLAQHKISSKLAMRVTRNAQHSMKEKNKNVPEEEIECLRNFVSEPLRMELHFEIFTPVLKVHPFFSRYIEEYPQVMRRVCHSAAAMEDVSSGDIIFHAGEIPTDPKMYFLCSGTLRYTSTDTTKFDLEAGDWVSEAALWTLWMYRGELAATSNCRLCVLESKQFQNLVSQFHHHGDFSPKNYAERFVARLSENASTTNDFNDLTDFSSFTKSLKRTKSLFQLASS